MHISGSTHRHITESTQCNSTVSTHHQSSHYICIDTSNQEKDRLQDRPYGPTLLGWCCAGIPDGTVPSRWLSRRSIMSSVGFSGWSRCSEVSASDIRPSGLRCLRPPNLELSSAQDQTIAWQFIAFLTETQSASVSAVLSGASVDPYLMMGLISFLYYYYHYYIVRLSYRTIVTSSHRHITVSTHRHITVSTHRHIPISTHRHITVSTSTSHHRPDCHIKKSSHRRIPASSHQSVKECCFTCSVLQSIYPTPSRVQLSYLVTLSNRAYKFAWKCSTVFH